MEVKKIYLGLIVLVIIILLCILNKKTLLRTYETFTCNLDDGVKTHLQAYYNRCINVYKLNDREDGTPVPNLNIYNDNSTREMVTYYLLQNDELEDHDIFTKFGYNPGWSNQINKKSIIPEWAYYLFKIQKAYLSENEDINNINNKIFNYLSKPEIVEDSSYYKKARPSDNYLEDWNNHKFKEGTKEINYHQILLLYFLSKIQRTEIGIPTSSLEGISLIWGLPYLMKKDKNKYKSINRIENVSNFANYFQIKFKPIDTSNLVKYLGYVDNKILLLNPSEVTPENSYFEIISANDCNQYLKIKTRHNQYLEINNNNNELSLGKNKDNELNKIILSNNLDTSINNLGIDINKIFIPSSIPGEREGESVNVLFRSGKICNHWIAHLGIIDNEPYVFKKKYDSINENDYLPNIFSNDDEKNYYQYYKGITFFRTDELVDKDKYVYREYKRAKAAGDSGFVEDIGSVYVINKDKIEEGFIHAGNNITTNQNIFPVVSDREIETSDSNSVVLDCKYTGTLTSEKDIESVCKNDQRCYGIFKDPNSNTKMAYAGGSCKRHLKYFDRYSTKNDEKIDRGKIKCYDIGDQKKIEDDKSYSICYLPKYNNKQVDNNLVSLQKLKSYNENDYCQINLDYGTLDSGNQFTMFVNNPACAGNYEYAGAPLTDDGRCTEDSKCKFDKYSNDDELFLINTSFGRIENENIELEKKLNKLSTKINNFKRNLETKNNNIESNNKILSDNLNEFKIIKMNDIMNNFNYHTYNELVDTHK